MAHKFSNFTDAYAYLNTRWSIARNFQNNAYDNASNAIGYANAGDWKNGIKQCAYGLMATLSAFDNLFENLNYDIESSVHGECLYWAAQGNGVEVDMDAILNAMLAADFDELRMFIGIEDGFRIAVWNEPFNAEFYAALARGFSRE